MQLDVLEPQVVDASGPASMINRDVNIYRCGDFKRLAQSQLLLPVPTNMSSLGVEERQALRSMNSFLQKQLVLRRNRRITKKLVTWLGQSRNSSYFIALGAGVFL